MYILWYFNIDTSKTSPIVWHNNSKVYKFLALKKYAAIKNK